MALTLPTEIKFEIAHYVFTKKAILSLLSCDSTFFHICEPILYRDIKLKVNTKQAVQWCTRILGDSKLAKYAQGIAIEDGLERETSNWEATIPTIRLVIKALARLQNLRTLCVHTPCFNVLHPNHNFPLLETFQGYISEVDIPFFERHRSIKKFEPWVAKENHCLPSGGKAAGFLPNLTYYVGPVVLVPFLAPTAPLERVVSDRCFGVNVSDSLYALIRIFGRTLRSLDFKPVSWELGLFSDILGMVPDLELLWIDCGDTRIAQLAITDITRSRNTNTILQELGVVLPVSELCNWKEQMKAVLEFRQACPSVRIIHFGRSGAGLEECHFEDKWRYNESKGIWMPPLLHNSWWDVTAKELGVTKEDYDAVISHVSGIHEPLLDWSPLS